MSPAGEMILGEIDGEVCICDWIGVGRESLYHRIGQRLGAEFKEGSTPVLDELKRELREYFEGERREFDLPLRFSGTNFQRQVWTRLRDIPYGKVISYAELAQSIGNPKAVRAVARANSQNPISILVPCHRVIGADGILTCYAGGLSIKRCLLAIEGVMPAILR